ncbi:GPP34 family phosphoprotein [Streptomyces sp. NPDC090080]|uniref:GOLPH3/VPS74 family protein n=1 Tax=Streptomyces sp. NPDC090080 TaxID=3365939 RepID=UPI003802B453
MELNVAENILLISRNPQGKSILSSDRESYVVVGALLAQLELDGLIGLVDERVSAVPDVTEPADYHPALRSFLARIRDESRNRKPKWWVRKAADKDLNEQLLSGLAERGLVNVASHRMLGLFSSHTWTPRDPLIVPSLVKELTTVLEGAECDDRTAALLSLIYTGGLSDLLFGHVDYDAREARFNGLAGHRWTAVAVYDAIMNAEAFNSGVIVGAATSV